MASPDGNIEIEALLTTNKFDKQILQLEQKLEEVEDKSADLDIDIKYWQEDIKEVEEFRKEVAKAKQEVEDLRKIDKKGFSKEQLASYKAEYDKKLSNYEFLLWKDTELMSPQYQEAYKGIAKAYKEQTKLTEQAKKYRNNIEALNLQKHQAEVAKVKENFKSVGSSLQTAVKRAGQLVLGIFAIRSAYSALASASSTLAQYDQQYATNIEYIRYALAQLVAPILQYILGLAKTILSYIYYIATAWFGVEKFANASAKSFNKVKNNIGGATANAKELQKTVSGFDEMNILNSSSTGGGGGIGGSNAIVPDFDALDFSGIEFPEWIKWIAQNKDKVIDAIKGIALAFLVFKTLQITGILGGVTKGISDFVNSLGVLNGTLFAIGIGTAIAGIILMIKGIIDYMNDPSWANFKKVLYGLELALAGVGAALIAVNKSNPVGWIIEGIAVIGALATAIVDLIVGEKNEKTTQDKLRESTEKLREAREKLTSATKEYMDAVDGAEDAERRLQEVQDETGISIDDLLNKMEKENLSYKDLTETERDVYRAYMENKDAQEKLKQTTTEVTWAQAQEKEALYKTIGALRESSSNYDEYKKAVKKAYDEGKISARDASKAISVALAEMDEDTRKEFTKDLPKNIKEGLNPNNYQREANEFKNWWNNNFIGGLVKKINMTVNAKSNTTGGSYQKMASGGILNMPNRGTLVGGGRAIAGEAGAEGIIPLTDQQAMSILGEEIGKNVVVNFTNITKVGNRQIAREIKQINANTEFAYNS